MTRVDFHTHVVVELPDHARRYDDKRWPSFEVDGELGRLSRDGKQVRAVPPSAWTPKLRLDDMDAAGVDVQVISPIPPTICDWPEPEPAATWTAHLNEGIAGMVAQFPQRFVGLGTIPVQHPERAVAELEHVHRLGLAGVEIGTTAGGREFDDPALVEVFATAERLGLLLFVHPLILEPQTPWTSRITGQELTFGLGMTTDTAIAASRLVFGGVTERFPRLRICLAHGGGTFFWALPRILHSRTLQQLPDATPLLANVFADSVVYEPANLAHLVRVAGADHVVFGTDYPLPAQDDLAGGVLRDLGADDAQLVGGETAVRLLDGRT